MTFKEKIATLVTRYEASTDYVWATLKLDLLKLAEEADKTISTMTEIVENQRETPD